MPFEFSYSADLKISYSADLKKKLYNPELQMRGGIEDNSRYM